MALDQIMTAEEARTAGIALLSDNQRTALYQWGLRMFALGQHLEGEIDEVKFDGRLIVLADGSRWEVESLDSDTAALWNILDKVVVIEGKMYNIEDAECVEVEESSL